MQLRNRSQYPDIPDSAHCVYKVRNTCQKPSMRQMANLTSGHTPQESLLTTRNGFQNRTPNVFEAEFDQEYEDDYGEFDEEERAGLYYTQNEQSEERSFAAALKKDDTAVSEDDPDKLIKLECHHLEATVAKMRPSV